MKDIREKAKLHAEQRKSDNTAAFESERQKAVQARRDELGAYTGQNVHMIPASGSTANDDRILRVAAYCRVSTDDIDQVISIELQKNNYRDMIKSNPKWKYVGTYVDDGFSGTNTEHRPGFNMMMRDAMDGKIDLIITKAVSRFARNLVECIECVRRLKKHEPPIAVFFEQENLNTLDTTSNIILFVLAMVAEEESHMKSEAMLLSLEWRFSRGRFLTPKLLGYDKVETTDASGIKKKVLVINEEQAAIVRYMYYSLLNGQSPTEIANNLTAMEIYTGGRRRDGTPNCHWTGSGVVTILRNERYCGDVLARKTWTPDFHDHKSKKNRGKKNKYYHPGHHEPIVTRAQWNAAQRILNSGKFSHSGSYKAMRVIEQGALRGFISINKAWAGFDLNEYYRVSSIVLGLEEGEPETNLEEEYLPEAGHKLAGIFEANGVQRIARQLSEAEEAVKKQLEGGSDTPEETATPAPPSKTKETMQTQFQVVSGEYFTHIYEPTLTIRSKSFHLNNTCMNKLSSFADEEGNVYIEVLLNPIERMLAVRPCRSEHPNAIRRSVLKGKSSPVSASVFCKLIYEMQGWDSDCSYKIPASIRAKDGEVVLFFDLDNEIAKGGKSITAIEELQRKLAESTAQHEAPPIEDEEKDLGFFFGADEEEPQSAEDIEAIRQKLLELSAVDKVTFGTLLREHLPSEKLSAIDNGELWDVNIEARILGDDHRVSDSVVAELKTTLNENKTRRT